MANSVREEIITELENTLSAIPEIKQVLERKSMIPELDNMDLPAAFIKLGPATKILTPNQQPVGAVIGKDTWEWSIVIGIYMHDEDEEQLLKIVSDALYNNCTLGGHAVFSDRMGDEILLIDPTDTYNVLIIDYIIYYRNDLGNL